MAHQTVLAFIDKLNTNPDLKNLVKSTNNVDSLLNIAAGEGFVFTAEEWRQTLTSLQSGELSEGDLDQVAGGGRATRLSVTIQDLPSSLSPNSPD